MFWAKDQRSLKGYRTSWAFPEITCKVVVIYMSWANRAAFVKKKQPKSPGFTQRSLFVVPVSVLSNHTSVLYKYIERFQSLREMSCFSFSICPEQADQRFLRRQWKVPVSSKDQLFWFLYLSWASRSAFLTKAMEGSSLCKICLLLVPLSVLTKHTSVPYGGNTRFQSLLKMSSFGFFICPKQANQRS